jgi:hypothetical protein
VQKLVEQAMVLAAGDSFAAAADRTSIAAAGQVKYLLLLLLEQEPDAKQLLEQQLFAAAETKVDTEKGLTSACFPGDAFSSIREELYRHSLLQSLRFLDLQVQLNAETGGSSSSVDSTALGAFAAECAGRLDRTTSLEPSPRLCKALDAALLVTRRQGTFM